MEILDSTAFAAFALGLFFGYWMGFGTSGLFNRGNSYDALTARDLLEKLSPEALDNVTDVIRDGRKLEAIKMVRAETQAGLKESKDAVEKLLADIRQARKKT